MARVGVVIVTYRSKSTIGACLLSLRAASAADVEIVVVDNASDDASAAAAGAADPKALVIGLSENVGYGAGNNTGWRALAEDTEFVVFANPDTAWPAGAIDALIHHMDASIGVLSPVLVGETGEVQAIVESDFSLGSVLRGMTRLGTPIRPRVPAASGDVDWVHTAAAVVPIEVVRATDGFDERFFLFAEDADFCRRVRALGKRVVVTTDVRVHHIGGASMDASHNAEELAGLRTRALATYLEHHQGRWARRVFGAVGTVVYGLARHRGQARAAWQALSR